jgi:transposase
MLAEGASFSTIKERLQTTAPTIIRWKQRFLASLLGVSKDAVQRV